MTTTKAKFQFIMQTQFPGLKTMEAVRTAFDKVMKSFVDTKLKLEQGLIPAEIGGKRLNNLRKQLSVLGKAVADAYDPTIKYVEDSKHAIEEVTSAVVKHKNAEVELEGQLKKVAKVMTGPAKAVTAAPEDLTKQLSQLKDVLLTEEQILAINKKMEGGYLDEAEALEMINEVLKETEESSQKYGENFKDIINPTKEMVALNKENAETIKKVVAEQKKAQPKFDFAGGISQALAKGRIAGGLVGRRQERGVISSAPMKAVAKAVQRTNTYVGKVVERYKKWKKIQEEINESVGKTKRELNRVEKAMAGIGKKLDRVSGKIKKTAKSIRAWGRNFLWLGRDITIFSSMAIGAAVKATTMWAKFQEQVVVTQRVLSRKEGKTTEEMGAEGIPVFRAEDFITGEGLMGQVMAAADSMAISISVATMAFGHLVRAGYETTRALAVAEQAMILNRGSMISLADATDMMITIQKNFNKEIYDAAKIADIMTVADMNAVASMSELQSGMGFVSGSAARFGMSLEQTVAAMTLMTNAGFSGSVAGRELRSVLNNLMQNAENYGITIEDVTGEMLPFETVLQNVQDELDTLDTELQRTSFLQQVFGETNVSMVNALLENRGELQGLTEDLKDSGGAADDAADRMKLTLEYRLDELRAGFEKVQMAIGVGFSRALVGGANFLENLAETLNAVLPVVEKVAYSFGVGFVGSLTFFIGIAQTVIDKALDVADALGLVEGGAVNMATGVKSGSDKLGFLGENLGKVAGFALIAGPAMMAIGMALEVLSPIMFGLSAAASILTAGFGVLGSVVGVLSSAIAVLTAAVSAAAAIIGAPVILIVLAIVAVALILGGVIWGLVQAFDAIVAAVEPGLTSVLLAIQYLFGALWSVIEPILGIIWTLIEILFKLGMIIAGVIKVIIEIIGFFGIWEVLFVGIAIVIGVVALALEGLGFALKVILAPLEFLGGILDGIIALLFGESPGLIPGLEESTYALNDFRSELEELDKSGTTISTNLGETNKELEAMVSHNFASWNQDRADEGSNVVELGSATLTALRKMLGKDEVEWSGWSFEKETPMSGISPSKKAALGYGGIGPR